jgi:S1-C subfamily serine protease
LGRSAELLKLLFASLLIVPIAFGQTTLTTTQIAKRVSPSVVVIQGKTESGEVLGSGFIVSKDGKIVTNLHVIRDMKTASVQLANGETFDSVSVLAIDERRDLAIVQIAGTDLPTLGLGNSDFLTVGEPLVIVGSPRGLEGTVTAGILSSVRDSGEGFNVLQTDAAVNPGNSGGPLVNNKGQAIGVVSFKLRSAEGLNFAIPINYVRGLLNNLREPMSLEQMRRSLVGMTSAVRKSDGPSLKETLDWLKEKIPLGTVRYLQSWHNDVHSINGQATVWSLDSCKVVVDDITTMTPESHPNGVTTVFTARYTTAARCTNGRRSCAY